MELHIDNPSGAGSIDDRVGWFTVKSLSKSRLQSLEPVDLFCDLAGRILRGYSADSGIDRGYRLSVGLLSLSPAAALAAAPQRTGAQRSSNSSLANTQRGELGRRSGRQEVRQVGPGAK